MIFLLNEVSFHSLVSSGRLSNGDEHLSFLCFFFFAGVEIELSQAKSL